MPIYLNGIFYKMPVNYDIITKCDLLFCKFLWFYRKRNENDHAIAIDFICFAKYTYIHAIHLSIEWDVKRIQFSRKKEQNNSESCSFSHFTFIFHMSSIHFALSYESMEKCQHMFAII